MMKPLPHQGSTYLHYGTCNMQICREPVLVLLLLVLVKIPAFDKFNTYINLIITLDEFFCSSFSSSSASISSAVERIVV